MASKKKATADVVKQHQQVANPRFTGYGTIQPGAGAAREKRNPTKPAGPSLSERAKRAVRGVSEAVKTAVVPSRKKPFEKSDFDIRVDANMDYMKFKKDLARGKAKRTTK